MKKDDINPFWNGTEDSDSIRIFEPKARIIGVPNVEMLSVNLTKAYTRIDFEMTMDIIDIKFHEFTIPPDIHLVTRADRKIFKSEKAFKFIKAENAPVYPEMEDAKVLGNHFYFTLFFEPLPLDTIYFDLIEDEFDDKDIWKMNYYDINLKKDTQNWEIANFYN